MTVGTTTGTDSEDKKLAFDVGVLEVDMPAAATAAAGAATLNQGAGLVTSETITTAAAAIYTLTLTNSFVDTDSIVLPSVRLGTATTGTPTVAAVRPGSGVVAIDVQNIHSATAFAGTIVIGFLVVRKATAI